MLLETMNYTKGHMMKLIAIMILAGVAAQAQTALSKAPVTDAEKIADALRAGPAFVTKDATLLDWPATPGGQYRVLRKGSSDWTCLPGVPGYPHDEPGCFDPVFLQWIEAGLAGRKAKIGKVGIAYMYIGAWVADKTSSEGTMHKEFHVGPHIMVITPHQDEVQSLNRDGSNGEPYVAHLPNQTDLFLVMPIREWGDK
jgi:hypothetical protein